MRKDRRGGKSDEEGATREERQGGRSEEEEGATRRKERHGGWSDCLRGSVRLSFHRSVYVSVHMSITHLSKTRKIVFGFKSVRGCMLSLLNTSLHLEKRLCPPKRLCPSKHKSKLEEDNNIYVIKLSFHPENASLALFC